MTDGWFYFGWRTALLGAALAHCLALAAALARERRNRVASGFLAGALVVIAGLLAPYAIGFAGVYDRFRGLTFAPFAIPLALGPLLYAYAHALADGRPPGRLRWHLVPAAIQFGYFALCFALPLGPKWDWYVGGHRHWVAPVLDAAAVASLGAYAVAVWGVLRRHRARLADQRSDDDAYAAAWLDRVLLAILAGLAAKTGFWLWSNLVGGIDYFQETGMYLVLGGVGVYLGVAGWRQAALAPSLATTSEIVEAEGGGEPAAAPDWSAIAADIVARTRAAGWWREPDLTLARLARRLGTNAGRLSRAINLGLGINFSSFVNGLRAEGVAEALAAGDRRDLLDLAFEMGFASKASFNRAFQARYGLSPSRYRRKASDPAFSPTSADLSREAL